IQRSLLTGHHRLLGPGDLRHAAGGFAHCRETFERLRCQRSIPDPQAHAVLCLHGFFRTRATFQPMVAALRAEGYHALSIEYPSTRRSLGAHADQVSEVLSHLPQCTTRVSFVAHSMGGMVARTLLARTEALWRARIEPHRLLMIATPNQGADILPWLDYVPALYAAAGPALRELHPLQAQAVPLPTIPFATIAGVRGDPRGWNPLIPGDDDLTVSAASVRLDGAEDHLDIRALHRTIAADPRVIRAAVRYLETGRLIGD
nr:alpha/beta fold hydrolase [Deltaproteobacteria bacterium]